MKKITFIVNPIAGGKDKSGILKTVEECLDRGKFTHEVIFTEYGGHATKIARECDGDIVVSIGGDGTLHEVATGLVGTGKTLGIIPCGSGDGLAFHLGISRNVRKAVETLNGCHSICMDCGSVCGDKFFCTTGVGLDAVVSWNFAKSTKRGLTTYISEAWRTWRNFVPENYRIEIDGVEVWNAPAVLITAGNANQWGNRAEITTGASVCDGLLDLTIVKPFKTVEIPFIAAKLMTKRMDRSRRALCLKGSGIRIIREKEGPAHYDGDPCLMGAEIDIDVVPGVLNVIVPEGKDRKF